MLFGKKGDVRMLAEGNSVSLFGEPYFFKSNDPLLLKEPETIWFVQSGSFALFAINVQNSNRVKQPLNQNEALLFAAGAVGKLWTLLFIKHYLLALSKERSHRSGLVLL